ncbi:vacuolar-sorting protein SNF8 [Zonotrichia leucophrys gambelii]|uniref:vacuolar-sorting protein SNF8 n=1 Tax=Zonotrichia leucophrys gambelii TaxID=257770 RepID=UPI003140571B
MTPSVALDDVSTARWRRHASLPAKYKERGTVLAEDQLAQMSKQLETFRTHLQAFASKHKQEIRRSPEFRLQFQHMCAAIGVDPLACERGQGTDGQTGGHGDQGTKKSHKIPPKNPKKSHKNPIKVPADPSPIAGLITLEELQQEVLKGRGKFAQDVSADDLLRAIRKLKVLGSGFGIIPVGGTVLVQSVPAELSMDHTVVLQLAEKKGFVTVSEIRDSLKWETELLDAIIPHFFPFSHFSLQDHLLKEGMAWLDAQAPAEPQFWLPALFSELHGQDGT